MILPCGRRYDGAQGKKDVRAGWKVTELQGEPTAGWTFWRAWRAAKSRERWPDWANPSARVGLPVRAN